MTEEGGRRTRSGGGCATSIGVVLIVVGGLALWANLAGAQLVLVVLDALPVLAVWWPAILVLWGASKLWTRYRTGSARLGFGEVVLIILLILFGSALSMGARFVGQQDLQFRFTEFGRWAEEQANPLPQHLFTTERVVPLPAEGPVEISFTLPSGGILVEAAEVAPDATTRQATLTLSQRVWAANEEAASARLDAVALSIERSEQATPEAADEVVDEAAEPVLPTTSVAVAVEDSGFPDVAFELKAVLPPGVRVSAASSEGPIRILGAFASATAQTTEAPLEVEGATGEVMLTARDGSVRVASIGGPLRIRGRRTVIEVASVLDAVSIESDGAPVWVANAGGAVTVHGEDTPVTIENAVGPVEVDTRVAPVTLNRIAREARVRSDYGPVLAESVGGRLDIGTRSSLIEVREARSAVDISGTGGRVLLERVAGALRVVSGGGEVYATALAGEASFTGDSGEITVRGFAGALAVDGGAADLDVATGALGGEVSLTTGSGDVRFEILEPARFALEATSREGDLASDFEVERTREDGVSRWAGSVGSPSAGERVTITTGSGDVELRTNGVESGDENP